MTLTTPATDELEQAPRRKRRNKPVTQSSLFDAALVKRAIGGAFVKLNPRHMARNPVMFVVEIGSVYVTFLFFRDLGSNTAADNWFAGMIAAWLWFTVLFANFAEAIAEGRGKAQAAALRRTRSETMALVRRAGGLEEVPSVQLQVGDLCVVDAGMVIPGDGDVVEGIASVDESAITGESAPVIRESGGDRTAVTGGTRVLSDQIVVRISTKPGESFIDRMIALVEGANRQKTPNEVALNILLAGLTIILLMATATIQPYATYSNSTQSVIILVALLVCLIPTTIGALLSAIGIAGMDRLVQRNVLAMSGRAVEAAGDISTLLLDKTGTITYGNRMASEFLPVPGIDEQDLAIAALLASEADETPEGRSIVEFAEKNYGLRPRDMPGAELIAFTAQTRMSGVDFEGRSFRKGAADNVRLWVIERGGIPPAGLDPIVTKVAGEGGTPLVVAEGARILGVIYLKDTVKTGIAERFEEMRVMGITTVMITGDNPLTAAKIAEEAGVDDFLAEATPEDKLALIKASQHDGSLVAMTGDGTNDAPALAQADVGVAMNTGTQAAKEAGNMVDLDSDPTKLLDIIEIGKQLLITRGSLTTFSIANDIAKYFAIIPAMFVVVFPELDSLNIMKLSNPHSAILSAVIFNALVIVALIPLALRGREVPAPHRRRGAPSEPVDLRRRRGRRPLHLHQAHRHRRHRHGSALMRNDLRQIIVSLRAFVVFTVVLCVAYPLAVFAIGQVAFKDKANGSVVEQNGTAVGSSLIAQDFQDPKYFAPRPSAAGVGYDGNGYDTFLSGGSNAGPTSEKLLSDCLPVPAVDESDEPIVDQDGNPVYETNPDGSPVCNTATVPQRVAAYRAANGLTDDASVPVDAVTASFSGLDPQISVANARIQARRVADVRGLSLDQVDGLVDRYTQGRSLGFLGEPGVNVIQLNLALDALPS